MSLFVDSILRTLSVYKDRARQGRSWTVTSTNTLKGNVGSYVYSISPTSGSFYYLKCCVHPALHALGPPVSSCFLSYGGSQYLSWIWSGQNILVVEQVGFITHDRKEGCSQQGTVPLSKMVLERAYCRTGVWVDFRRVWGSGVFLRVNVVRKQVILWLDRIKKS